VQVLEKIGGQGRNRTTDTRIFNPLLYQLSYLAKLIKPATSGRGFSILAYPVALRPRYRANFSNRRLPDADFQSLPTLSRCDPATELNFQTFGALGGAILPSWVGKQRAIKAGDPRRVKAHWLDVNDCAVF
jgi:hypothetical protein